MNIFDAVQSGNLVELKRNLAASSFSPISLDARYDGDTLLHIAVKANFSIIAEKLVEAGAPIDVQDNYGRTPLCLAAEKKKHTLVKILTEKKTWTDTIDIQDHEGKTALYHAVENNDAESVRLLLKAGANPDIQNTNGRTALYQAAENKSSPIAKFLLDAGANPDIQNGNGWTPLHRAAYHSGTTASSMDIVTLLVSARANPFIGNPNGKTASQSPTTFEIKALLQSYEKEWTEKNLGEQARVPRLQAKTPVSTSGAQMSPQTRKNIELLEKSIPARGHGVTSGVAASPDNQDAPSASAPQNWTLFPPSTIAHVSDYSPVGYRLTEIFNFETRQYLMITRNTDSGFESATQSGFDDLRDKTALSRAFDALTKAGGKADPHVINSGYLLRHKEALIRPKPPAAIPPSPETGG